MKVLIADKFEQSGIDGLKAAGCDVVYQPDLKDDALTQALRESKADVLVVRSTAVTGPMLEAGSLSLIVRAGAGYNTIDVATASARGTRTLEQQVDSGKAAVAFALFPVSVADLMAVSDAGEIMPPKSTWFEPKLRDGLLVHVI